MHRLFVALRPPPPVRAALIATMTGVYGARWQGDDQLHLTLRFIGAVERPQAEDIAAALAGMDARAPMLSVVGAGTFTRRDRPHTLWAGVAPRDALADLHRKVDRAVARAGVAADARAFHPHITLARMNASVDRVALARWLDHHARLATDAFVASHVVLCESHLGSAGAHYEAVARWPLTAGEPA